MGGSTMQFHVKTIGDATYLVKNFEGGQGLINYQLQMLTGNEIKNVVNASKRQQNESIMILYNITGKKSFADAVADRKISKAYALNFIKGTIKALKELEDYQLATGGVIFDLQYIYVNDKFEPEYIYVPNTSENTGLEQFKQVLKTLIIDGKFEMTSDNFIQRLLEVVNKADLRISDLKSVCEGKNTAVKADIQTTPKAKEPEVSAPTVVNAAVPPAQSQMPMQTDQAHTIPKQVEKPQKKMPAMPNAKPTEEKIEEPAEPKSKETKSGGGKKVIFIILQVVLIAVLAGLYVSGLFKNDDGSLNIQYLLGGLIGVAAVDFIVFREIFVNNKTKENDKKEPEKQKKTNSAVKKPSVSVPGKDLPKKQPAPSKVNIPGKPNLPGNAKAEPVQSTDDHPAPAVHNSIPAAQSSFVPQPVTGVAVAPMDDYAEEGTVIMDDMENTVVMDENSGSAYLEYYENGLSTKFYLNKERTIIGKLRTQCDYFINNNKVSKIHAEFIKRGTEYFVKDYNSTNGTYINGSNQRLAGNAEYQIYNGDRITLANVDLTFMC